MLSKAKELFNSWVESFSDEVEAPPFWANYEVPSAFQWKRLAKDAKIPIRATEGSAGFDLYALGEGELDLDILIGPKSRQWIPTGMAIAIPEGWVGFVWPRSGLAGKGIDVSAGVIDSDFRGELKVLLVNNSNEEFIVHPGDRIAQLILVQTLAFPDFSVVEELSATSRGSAGFGSTGIDK